MRTQLISNSTPDGSVLQAPKHKTVLLQEVLDLLDIQSNDRVFDGTLGSAGHAVAILKILGKDAYYLASDLDPKAIERSLERIKKIKPKAKIFTCNKSFKDIKDCLDTAQLSSVDKILLDLGWSQDQFEDSGKGFSFMKDEKLDMRFGDSDEYIFNAYDIVNFWQVENIEEIIKGFGGERFAGRIARAIDKARSIAPIKTSAELAEIVRKAYPRFKSKSKIHPATKTFQALRIAVNRELETLQEALDNMHSVLSPGGRIAVISFHSLEDRIVKRKFKQWVKEGHGLLINKKPITASKEELKTNKRARSAKLRVYEKNTQTKKNQEKSQPSCSA